MDTNIADNFDTYTRSFLDSYLKQKIYEAKRYEQNLSLVVFEIDDLQNYSESEQEYIVNRITFLVSSIIRRSDSFAKYSDTEYAIVLPNTNLQGALNVAVKIKLSMDSSTIEYNQKIINGSLSFGVTTLKPTDDNISIISRVLELVGSAKQKKNSIEIL